MRPTTNMKSSPVRPVSGCTSSTERPASCWAKTESKAASVGGLFHSKTLTIVLVAFVVEVKPVLIPKSGVVRIHFVDEVVIVATELHERDGRPKMFA